MEFRTLEHCSLAQITETFNHAFSDYLIPLKLTEAMMAEKFKTENILAELSAGAFDSGRMVGFILHGYDLVDGVPTVYNAGTGVISSHRGKGITQSLYQFILPRLHEKDIHRHVLEVISTNTPAIRVYEKMGFKKQRDLGVYKKTEPFGFQSDMIIKEGGLNESQLKTFNSCDPSWQNNTASILRNPDGHMTLAAFDGDKIIGYAVYAQATGRVKQLAVHPQHRGKKVGTALVSYMMQHKQSEALVFTNIDLGYHPAIAFLQSLGFQQLLVQFEMKMS